MGSFPSRLEVAAAGLVIVASAFFFTWRPLVPTAQENSKDAKSSKNKKTKKGKKKAVNATSTIETRVDEGVDNKVVLEPKILSSATTEGNSTPPSTSASSKQRRTKASTRSKPPPHVPSSSSLRGTTTNTTSSSVADDDGWTKITGEKGESDLEQSTRIAIPDQQTLAERLLPKHAVTPVDDMLAEKPGGIARVIRVKAADKPPSGFSWKDFDNVEQVDDDEEARQDDDDEGWGVVRSKTRSRPAGGASSTSSLGQATPPADMTKKQRQNTARREAQKAAKVEAERLRLDKLAQHRREAERAKIAQQYASGSGKGKGNLSGGMKASVDSTGALIWE